MSIYKWSDASSDGTTFIAGSFPEVIVTRHIDYLGKWVLKCHAIGVNTYCLKSFELEKAKLEALSLVMSRLKKLTSNLEKVFEANRPDDIKVKLNQARNVVDNMSDTYTFQKAREAVEELKSLGYQEDPEVCWLESLLPPKED